MEKWAGNYEYVIVDSPAGVEHLNRRITKEVKDVFNILDPSKKSFDNAKRSYKIMRDVGIIFQNYYLVGGHRFPENLVKEAENQPFPFLGRIEFDEQVLNYNLKGRSLLDIPDSSQTYKSVREILRVSGYKKKPPDLSELLQIE
jgi:CO dehydrogenase maturation factor